MKQNNSEHFVVVITFSMLLRFSKRNHVKKPMVSLLEHLRSKREILFCPDARQSIPADGMKEGFISFIYIV